MYAIIDYPVINDKQTCVRLGYNSEFITDRQSSGLHKYKTRIQLTIQYGWDKFKFTATTIHTPAAQLTTAGRN